MTFCNSALLKEGTVQVSHSVVSNSLRPHESQHARPPCPQMKRQRCDTGSSFRHWLSSQQVEQALSCLVCFSVLLLGPDLSLYAHTSGWHACQPPVLHHSSPWWITHGVTSRRHQPHGRTSLSLAAASSWRMWVHHLSPVFLGSIPVPATQGLHN